ncbi:hypothetical protein BCF74_12157 [Knoellia remsis]|uniref:SGNH domain-containing protein n=2 Tax=Knoellia remsis TaxID=407159 RepID=A0A2T0UD64_9MICO|nr:hypothetical protein BCF74_12157 [Knoellia remsis]
MLSRPTRAGTPTGPGRALIWLALTLVVGTVVGCTGSPAADPRESSATAATNSTATPDPDDPCLGPRSLVPANSCDPVQGDGPLLASPQSVSAQLKDPLLQRCQASIAGTELRDCVLGTTASPRETVALVGDSHAISLLRTFDELGKRRGWKVIVHGKGSCPSSDAVRTLPTEATPERRNACHAYNRAVDAALLADRSVTRIFATSYTARYGWLPLGGATGAAAGEKGFTTRFERWRRAGKQVVVIADVPTPKKGVSMPDCVAANPGPSDACTTPRAEAVVPDLAVTAARALGITVVDLTDLFCDDTTCYGLVGDTIVYRDTDHLAFEYAALLAPYLDERLG